MRRGCVSATSGGKGNRGMFIDRSPHICSAGVVSAQADIGVKDCMKQYLLKDHVDALISDTIFPEPEVKPLPPLRKPIALDMRYAGPYCAVAELVSPPKKTKFQTLVEDLKSTVYKSYWKTPLAQTIDPTPMLPAGFDIEGTTFGKKSTQEESVYNLIMPKDPLPDKTPKSKQPGAQLSRNYCSPPFSPDLTYGARLGINSEGIYAKCCFVDKNIKLGTSRYAPMNALHAEYRDRWAPKIATSLTPNNNINMVPPGHAFGKLYPSENVAQCLVACQLNPAVMVFKKCLGHLNTLRRSLKKRFLPRFFSTFYLSLKYEDKDKKGWLPKAKIYEICTKHHIVFDHSLIEPLLCAWNAFDGSNIEYKTFVDVINFREHIPKLPKIADVDEKCLDFSSTYMEMTKPGQELGYPMRAGLPSGRYFDTDFPLTPENCAKAHRICLPHETDARCLLNPSIFSLLGVTHRHMFCKREPEELRKIYKNAGESFTDEQFNALWEKAKELHSEGWVCIETFRKTMNNHPEIVGEAAE